MLYDARIYSVVIHIINLQMLTSRAPIYSHSVDMRLKDVENNRPAAVL